MQDIETIDEIAYKNKILLCSKLSIALLGFLFSPIFASYLYCTNLRRIGKPEKIISFFFSIIVFNFLTLVPFLGFSLEWNNILPLLYLNNIIVTLLMIFPFWKNHFKGIDYTEFFPTSRFLLLILLIISVEAFNYLADTSFDRYTPAPWYLPYFNTITVTIYSIPLIFGRFILQLLKKIIQLITPN